ncbi:hypothetical protein GGR57DRAFT_414855 [Xylariaceae sp. FL1272]|nr:hypothetical protein GGR57DRAFT_414855 [Xylariaceae sp. FL1272]
MMTTLLFAALVAVAKVGADVNARAVRSSTPYSCNAVGGVSVTFEDDMSFMYASLRDLYLYVDTPSHGLPPSYSIMSCMAEVEFVESDFGSGTSQARFAIANVTWSNNNLTLEKGDNFNQLNTKVDLNIEVSNATSPVQYPIGKDLYSGNLIDLKSNPAIGVEDSYSGPFSFTAQNPNPVFTPCFLGREYHALKFEFNFFGETKDGGVSSTGWNVDFGLIYEPCQWTEASDNWGQTQIKPWETCTYRQANQTTGKETSHGLY